MEIKRQSEDIPEDDVVKELENLTLNWKIFNKQVSKETIKLVELNRDIPK